MAPPETPLPTPSRDRWPLALAGVALLAGALLLALALGGARDRARATPTPTPTPPAVPAVAVVVPPAPTAQATVPETAAPAAKKSESDEERFRANDLAHVSAGSVAGFYPLYAAAQKAFGVNWLLIASVHKQETAFSTHPTTYHGLNFARCCAGPMQFNVTNGPVSTWTRFREAWRRAPRPASYPHRSLRHPSVYDDFDAIMAAAALLRSSGAGLQLDVSSWRAAYDYYGHDLSGVDYADQVVARALGWGRTRFCINCAVDSGVLSAVTAAWGDPVRHESDAAAEVARARRGSR